MRFFILLFLAAGVFSCDQKPSQKTVDPFVVKKYSVPIPNKINNTIYYKNHYYCLTDSGQFICLNDKFQIENALTKTINQLKFSFTYLSNDTLIAGYFEKNAEKAKKFYLDKDQKWQAVKKEPLFDPLFEDERFIINNSCFGEFGGSLFFEDKKTKRLYGFPANCTVIINKIKKNYFATVVYPGLTSELFKIDDPTKLYEIKTDSLKYRYDWHRYLLGPSDDEAAWKPFFAGTKKVADPLGAHAMTSFVADNKLYHITVDYNKTYISQIQNDSLIRLSTIFNQALISYNDRANINETTNLSTFNSRNGELSGFLTVRHDTVSIITFDNPKNK